MKKLLVAGLVFMGTVGIGKADLVGPAAYFRTIVVTVQCADPNVSVNISLCTAGATRSVNLRADAKGMVKNTFTNVWKAPGIISATYIQGEDARGNFIMRSGFMDIDANTTVVSFSTH